MTMYRFMIATGQVIHDVIDISAASEADAQTLLQRRIDLGEFDVSNLDISADASRPLDIHFPVTARPHIVGVIPTPGS